MSEIFWVHSPLPTDGLNGSGIPQRAGIASCYDPREEGAWRSAAPASVN